jgi:hypothetical protein
MADSKTVIANMALAFMREPPLVGTLSGDNDPRADYLNGAWKNARKIVLKAVRPSFARVQVVLVATTTPIAEYGYSFLLPVGFLKIIKFNGLTGRKAEEQFVQFGLELYTNAETATITYIQDEENTGIYEALFEEAFAYKLAHLVAPLLRIDTAAVQELRKEYERAKGLASLEARASSKLEMLSAKRLADSPLEISREYGPNE